MTATQHIGVYHEHKFRSNMANIVRNADFYTSIRNQSKICCIQLFSVMYVLLNNPQIIII